MNLEKESKTLEQTIKIWLLFIFATLTTWGILSAFTAYILSFFELLAVYYWITLLTLTTLIAFIITFTFRKVIWK